MDSKELLERVSVKYDQKDFQGALSDVEKLIQIEPRNPSHYMARGDIRERLKDVQGSISDFKQGIELQPNDEGLRSRLAVSFYGRGEWLNAASAYSNILEINPENLAALLMRGNCQRELGNYQAAVDDYSTYIKLTSNQPEGYQSRAVALAKLGRLDEAKEDIERAGQAQFSNNERKAFVHMSIGNFYQEYKHSEDARRHWKIALDLYQQSNHSDKARVTEMLQRNLQDPDDKTLSELLC
ncbi:tetratricopeptide repeat protein [Phormidesmis priestleyi]